MTRKKKVFFVVLGLLAINVYFLIALILEKPLKDNLRVIFFDVGQGDGSLITAENGLNILVDGGPDKKVVEKLDKYLPLLSKKIDIVILTHPHSDHVMGLIDVLKKFEIKEIWMTGVLHPSPDYLEFLKLVRDKKIKAKIIDHPEKYRLADETYLETLYPLKSLAGYKVENLNNTSIVFRLSYKSKSFLFTGDIEEGGGKELMKNNNLLAEVLKIAHHGSDNTSSEKFLEEVKPRLAVISVGKDNQFGMPSLRTLNRLKNLGVKIYRTDEDGDIIINTDGQGIDVD